MARRGRRGADDISLTLEIEREDIAVDRVGELVRVSSDLARAWWTTDNIWELRIVAAMSTLVRGEDEDFHTYRIPLSALCADLSLGRNYTDIKAAAESLTHRKIKVINRDRRRKRGQEPFFFFSVCSKCGVDEDGVLHFSFHPDLKPLYLDLKREFTLFRADELRALPTGYSQKLYLFLRSWSGVGEITVPIEEMRDRLGVPQSFRDKFSNLKDRVLIPCQRHIHERTGLRYQWEPIKRGRAFAAIRFIFISDTEEVIDDRDEQYRNESIECRRRLGVRIIGGCPEPPERRVQLKCFRCVADPRFLEISDPARGREQLP